MAYTTPSAVRMVLSADGDASDPSSAAGLDDQTLAGPCQQASDEVDARLSTRYVTPFPANSTPTVVSSIATDIAAYLATLVYRKGQPVETTDPVYLRYTRSLSFLKDLTSGAAQLPAVVAVGPGEVVVSNPTGTVAMFGPDDYDLFPTPGSGRLSAERFAFNEWR